MKIKSKKLIFLIVYLAYTSIYVARINLSMAGPDLLSTGALDEVQLGLLGSVFSTLYACGRLINGGISDKRPPWQMLTAGLIIAGVSNLAISFLPPFIAIFIFWTANAYAQSMLWSSVLCVVSSLYDKQTAKRKTTVMVTSVAVGNIAAIIICSYLITAFGVRFAFIVPGALTVILGALVFLSTKDIKQTEAPAKKHKSMWQLLKDRHIALMIFPALFHGVMKENISLWMTVFIVDTYNVDLSKSAYYILMIPVIGLIGRTVYTFVYKLCKEKENTVSLIGFVICILCSVLLSVGKTYMIVSVLALSLIYAAVSMINTSMLSILPLHYVKSQNVASVSGIMDFATYLGGGIGSFAYGILIKSLGYTPMFISWAVISVISFIIILKSNIERKKENSQ